MNEWPRERTRDYLKHSITQQLKSNPLKIGKIYLLFVSCSLAARAQIAPNLVRAYEETTKLRVELAKQYLAKEKDEKGLINKGFGLYVENYADMVTLMVSDDARLFGQLAPRQDQRLEALEDLPDTSPYQRFLKAEIQIGRAHV